MGTVILISTVAIIVAIVGCFFIWRLDAARAEEVVGPRTPEPPRRPLRAEAVPAAPRSIDS